MPKKRILVVDDEPSMRELLAIMLKKEGFDVVTAEGRAMAAAVLGQGPVDLVVTDVRLPDGDGIEILRHVKSASPETVVIVMTAFGTAETAVAALKLGAHDYILKPFDVDELKIVVRNALEREDLRAENLLLKRELGRQHGLDQVIGVSPAMTALFEMIRVDRSHRLDRARDRRERHGKGDGLEGHPFPLPASRGAVRLRQLRGPAGHAARERALRPHEGRVHRRPSEQEGSLRSRAPGDPVPRRGGRDLPLHAGQAPAGAPGAQDPSGGEHRRDRGGRAGDLGHQRAPGATRPGDVASAKTCSIACRSSRSGRRRFANGARTSPSWRSTS